MVRLRAKSRTDTRPRPPVTRVPSQRSCPPQRVPRTVAAALRPRVRNEPLPSPNSRRTRLRERRRDTVANFVVAQARRHDEPVRLSSVISPVDRRPDLVRGLRTCPITKRPPENRPRWARGGGGFARGRGALPP